MTHGRPPGLQPHHERKTDVIPPSPAAAIESDRNGYRMRWWSGSPRTPPRSYRQKGVIAPCCLRVSCGLGNWLPNAVMMCPAGDRKLKHLSTPGAGRDAKLREHLASASRSGNAVVGWRGLALLDDTCPVLTCARR